jgi:hypothetical protein
MWSAIIFLGGLGIGYLVGTCEYRLPRSFPSIQILELWELALVLSISLCIYIFFISLPLAKIVDAEVKTPASRKRVSARQELKRRGSWPIAYAKNIQFKYQPNEVF